MPYDCPATGAPAALVMTFAGVLGCVGFNAAGLGVGINFLEACDVGIGVLYPFIVRRLLSQVRVGDALGAVIVAPRASGMHYLIGDTHSLLASVEVSGMHHDVSLTTDGLIAHANHYTSPSMRRYDTMVGISARDTTVSRRGSTLVRQHIAETALRRGTGDIYKEYLMNLCRDHVNYPYSVCYHGNQDLPLEERSATVASLIMELRRKEIQINTGSVHPDVSTVARLA